MKRTKAKLFFALIAASVALAALSVGSQMSDPVAAARAMAAKMGVDVENAHIARGSYRTGFLLQSGEVELIERAGEGGRVRVEVERYPFTGWRLRSFARVTTPDSDRNAGTETGG